MIMPSAYLTLRADTTLLECGRLIYGLLWAVGHTAPTAATTIAATATAISEDGFILTTTFTSTLYIKQCSRQGCGKHNLQDETHNRCNSYNHRYSIKES